MKIYKKIDFQDLFDLESLTDELAEYLNQVYDDISRPRFYLKEIGVSAKLMNDWIKAELVDKSLEDGKWKQFSFKEAIWINFIGELRYFGVSLREIKNFKKIYFDKNPEVELEAMKFFIDNQEANPTYKAIAENYKTMLDAFGGDSMALSRSVKDYFSTLIVFTLTRSLDPVFILSREMEGFFYPIELEYDSKEIDEKMDQFNSIISSNSFACINLKSLIRRFFDEDKPNADLDFYMGLLKAKERELINKIRSGDYSKIILNMEEEKIVLTKALKKRDDALLKQLARLMKKGEYRDIEISSRDGKIIKFNAFELTK